MNTETLFSSGTDNWETPPELFYELHREFKFTLDAAALPATAKVPHFFSPEQDALTQDWGQHTVWLNPPYSRGLQRKFIEKAYQSSLPVATTVLLIPARTDTRVWHDYCMKGEIRFIEGRIKFVGAESGAPFPSAIVIFRPGGSLKVSAMRKKERVQ